MAPPRFQRLVIYGVGLLGGSLGMAVRRRAMAGRIVGLGRSLERLERARQLGAIDECHTTPQAALAGADALVLALPPRQIRERLADLAELIPAGAFVTDVGSVKARIVARAEEALPEALLFIGSHPMAGSEKSGAEHGRSDFYEDHACILEENETFAAWVNLVFHLAAAVGVQLIVKRPVHTIETNIHGTEQVLRLAAKRGTRVLITSTSEVYGKSPHVPFREDDDMVLGPTTKARWSYACSKAIDEFLALSYWREQQLPTTVVRLFNTVGPRQVGRYGMVIPRFVDQALSGGPICVYGDGEQTRCFCDVSDVVAAMAKLLSCDEARGQVFNLGSDEEVSINELAERIRSRIDPGLEIRHVPYSEAYEEGFEDLRRRVPDLSRARKRIGFKPSRDLDAILDRIIAWRRQPPEARS